jgi:hypothetical protein
VSARRIAQVIAIALRTIAGLVTVLPMLDPFGILDYDLTGLVSQEVVLIVLWCMCLLIAVLSAFVLGIDALERDDREDTFDDRFLKPA